MKKTSIIAIIAIACVAVFSACGNKAKTAEEAPEAVAISVDEVLANADSLAGDTITIEGVCSHLCSHGAMKAFIAGSADSIMLRCEANPYMGQAFPLDMTRRPVQVKGILVEQRIDSAAVVQMEEQYKTALAQAAAQGQDTTTTHASGCETERTAQGQRDITSFADRMEDYRQKIAARNEKDGKPYLSFYYLQAMYYEVLPE
ncbi:MAG: hypothetical protein J6J93_05895 [Muribaculaceae bacterium]|nr:hypothetical protein [Muribaculaceae bacterium]